MSHPTQISAERLGFTLLVAGLLAPVIAHGLWLPLAHGFGSGGDALQLTWAALTIASLNALARWFGGDWALGLRLLLAGLAAVVLSLGLSLGLAGLGALGAVAMTTGWLFETLPPRLPPAFDGLARRHWGLATLYTLVAFVGLLMTARLSVFIGEPTAVAYQTLPGEPFTEVHSCLTAYVRASGLARQGVENLYADVWWSGSHGLPPLPEGVENPYRPFHLDNLSYPPTFLLLMWPLAALDGDFLAQRALWFGFNGLFGAFGLWAVARWIGGPAAHRALLLAPLVFGSVPILVTLQIGNFHLAATVLTLLAMVALDRGRAATGGALLAMAILSKIAPGLLGVVLLVQRRFREAALAAGFGALLLALALFFFGTDPAWHFVTFALPRLSSGEAFPFMDTPNGIATNMSPFGVPFKLRVLGIETGDPWQLGRVVARVYTVGLVLLAIIAARRAGDRRDQAIRWLALLTLASLQSPFAPGYSTIGLLWATTLLAVEVRRAREAVAIIALWPAILFAPLGQSLETFATISVAQTALTIGVSVWLVARRARE